MPFRVPVLETFLWQKEVIDFISVIPDNDEAVKGDRYILDVDITSLKASRGDIIWYAGGGEWGVDSPQTGWTTVVTNTDKFPETGSKWNLIRFGSDKKWNLYTIDQLHMDSTEFNIQIPKADPDHKNAAGEDLPWTLQHLVEWMDRNMGGPGPLGTPTDKTYGDGLFDWTNKTKVNDAIDDTNEALKDLAPAKPDALTGISLNVNFAAPGQKDNTQTQAFKSGFLSKNNASDGMKNWLVTSKKAFSKPDAETGEVAELAANEFIEFVGEYVPSENTGTTIKTKSSHTFAPGERVDNIIRTDSILLSTPEPTGQTSGSFSYGDKGIVRALFVNAEAGNLDASPITDEEAGVTASFNMSFDMGENYYENVPGKPRFPRQNLALWFLKGKGYGTITTSPDPSAEVKAAVQKDESGVKTYGKAFMDEWGKVKDEYNYSDGIGNYAQVNEPGTANYLRLLEVKKFNGFNLWQKVTAQIYYEGLKPGYNAFYLTHEYSGNQDATNATEVFYDNDSEQLVIENLNGTKVHCITVPTEVLETISGISYYTKDTVFKVNDLKVNNQISSVYGNVKAANKNIAKITNTCGTTGTLNFAPGGNDISVSEPPVKGSEVVYTPELPLDKTTTTANLEFAAEFYHPYKQVKTATLRNDKNIVANYAVTSNSGKYEDFKRENYRIDPTRGNDGNPDSVYNFDSTTPTSNWDKTKNLSQTSDAIIYLNKLRKNTGSTDLSKCLPENNPNYANLHTSASEGVRYFRFFKSATSNVNTNVKFDFTGTIDLKNQLKPFGTTSGLNLRIKLPGMSQWLDGGKVYSGNTFTAAENQGCRDSADSSLQSKSVVLTFGNLSGRTTPLGYSGAMSTGFCGNTIYFELTIYDPSIEIDTITAQNWTV